MIQMAERVVCDNPDRTDIRASYDGIGKADGYARPVGILPTNLFCLNPIYEAAASNVQNQS